MYEHLDRRYALALYEVAEKEGFIMVYPDGMGVTKYKFHGWNSGYVAANVTEGVDDVAFIELCNHCCLLHYVRQADFGSNNLAGC